MQVIKEWYRISFKAIKREKLAGDKGRDGLGINDDGSVEVYSRAKNGDIYRVIFEPYEVLEMAAFLISHAEFKPVNKRKKKA